MNGQKLRALVRARWQAIALYGGLFAALGVLQFLMLGSLLNGFSADEVQSYQRGAHMQLLGANPFNLPFYLVEHVLIKLMPGNLAATRLASALFGFLALIVFCAVLRAWYGRRAALFGIVPVPWCMTT